MQKMLLLSTESSVNNMTVSATDFVNIEARKGASYTLIDQDTGQYPKHLSMQQDGDDLTILQNGEPILVIKQYYQDESAATFLDTGYLTADKDVTLVELQSNTVNEIGPVWSADGAKTTEQSNISPAWLAGLATIAGGVFAGNVSNNDAHVPVDNSYTITVAGTAGHLTSTAQVTVYDNAGNVLIQQAHDFSQGNYIYSVTNGYIGTLLITVTDINGDASDYSDETTGNDTSLNSTLRAMAVSDGSGDITVNITPLTELATKLAGVGEDNTVSESQVAFNAAVANLFGVDDILALATTVTDSLFDTTDGLSSAENYGVVLAALSGVDSASGSLVATLEQLFSEITVADDGLVAITQNGLDTITAGIAAYNASDAGQANPITTNTLSAPLISKASGGLTAEEVESGITITVSGVSGDAVIINWGGIKYSYTLTDADMLGNGKGIITIPANIIAQVGDGNVAVRYTLGEKSSAAVIINLDTADIIAPAAPNLALASDTGSSSSDGITHDATINVSGLEAGATWQYSTDGGANWTIGSGTSFELAPDTTYAMGDIQVKQTDAASNVSVAASNTATIITDNTLAAPSLALATDTGSSSSDGITSDATVTVTLAADAVIWQYSTDGGTNWTIGSGTSFELGADTTYTIDDIQVKQTDTAGNVSVAASNAAAIIIDNTVAAPGLALATDTGSSSSDGITTDATVNVSGLEVGATWQYSLNSGADWLDGTGTSFELAADNTYAIGSIQVKQTDAAGNASATTSSAATINVDNTLDTNNDLAVTPLDAILNATDVSAVSVALSGIDADAQSVTVSYSKDLTFNESVNATYANGVWSAPAIDLSHWSDGEISYAVIVTDIAGNTNVVGVFDESTLNMVITENGVSLDPNGLGANAQSIKVIIADDDNGTDDVIINAIKTDGTWAFPNADLSGLTGASRTLSIEIINLDGSQLTQVINNVLPAITLDTVVATPSLALATDTGSLSSDGITTDATMNVSGLEVGATWQYSLDGATTWLDGSGTSFELGADTTYAIADIQVKQTDAAGNMSAVASNTTVIIIDNTAPIGSLSATPTWLEAIGNASGNDSTAQVSTVGNDGAYVVTWHGQNSDVGNKNSVFVQLFKVDGSINSNPVKLDAIGNTNVSNYNPQVSAVGSDGAYVVTWQGQDSGYDFSIFAQLFKADGTIEGVTVRLESIGNNRDPQVSAVGNDGAYVITWSGYDNNNDYRIFVQLFKADGTIDGAAVQLEALGNFSGYESAPQVTALGNGGAYVVTWQGQDSANDYSIFVQGFNANGSINGDTVQLDATDNFSGFDVSPQVTAVGNDGAYVLTWSGQVSNNDFRIFVQQFKADGTIDGTAVQLDANGNLGSNSSPQVSAVGNYGAYVVTWQGEDSEGDDSIYVQLFKADGSINGATVQLEAVDNSFSDDYSPQVSAVGNDGAYVVTWSGVDSDGDNSIFVQLFNADGTINGTAVQLEAIGNISGGDFAPQVSSVGNDGAYVVTWQGEDSEGDSSIFVQLFNADGRPVAKSLLNNTQSIEVQSSEVGTAYLVSAAVNVSSLSDIAALADNTYNSVAIESINTYTSLAASGLVDGTYYVYVTDVAGNFGQISQVITIDSTAPAAPNFALTTDTGSSDSDGITSDATVNVTLAADVASWQYSLDGGDNWLDGNGTSFELAANTAYAIADIQVKQTDTAGNISATTSNDASITTDTTLTAPSFVLATDTGTSNSDGITNDATMNVTLAADVASWQYSLDGGVNWATGSGTSFELAADATYAIADIQVKQTDTAGNTSAVASNTATITIDNTAPLSPLISNPTWLEATGNASGTDQAPQVTAVGNEGAYVVTWQGQDSNTSIYVQLFKADGTIDGAAVQLAALDNALSYNSSPQVSAVGNDGGYVVTWWGQDSENDYSVFVQLFNADGINGSAVQLEAIGNASGYDSYPQVSAVGNDGAYVVTWQGQDSNNDYSVFVQLFNADGSINGAAVQLEAIGNTLGADYDPQVTGVGNDGAYVVTWQGNDSDADYSIFVQLFNTDGTINGGAVQLEAIGNAAGHDTYPQVSAVGIDGAYVVTWQGRNSVDYNGIFVQLFKADGSTNGATVQLDANDNIFGYNEKPQVSSVGNGGAYVVTWFADDNDDDDDSIFVQLFKADGTINGATVQLEATGYAYGTDESPQVSAVGNDGAFVITWSGQNSDGDYSIFVQSFKADGTLNGTAVKLDAIGNTSGYDEAPQVSAVGNDGAYVVTWKGEDSNNDYSIFVQLFDADGRPVANSLLNNTQSIAVQSSEVGTAYLVSAAVAVTSLNDITALADNLYNSVAIESVNTDTALAASGLVDGTYYVYVADTAGNFSQTTQVITIDTTAPDAPSFALATDSGSSNSDNLTNDATVNVTGLEIGATWHYSLDGGTNWTTGSDTSFELGADATYAIADIQVKQTDAAGNISTAASNAAAITTDTTLAAPILALATDTGSSNSDGITNDATVNVTLAADVASWQYSLNGGSTWTAGSGTSFELAANTAYAIGDIQVKQTDTAGNTSSAVTNAGAITTDTTLAAPSLALATDTGSSNSDGITTDATVNVTLAADVASWQYSLNGGSTWTAGSGTSFELAANTAYAIGDIQVKQTDTASNTSSAVSNTATITTDTTLAVPSLALATDTGSSNSDGITTDATVNVTLAADVASWQYSLNGGSTWTAGSGTSFELADDTAYTIGDIQVKQTDTAGNTSSAVSNAATITTDATLAAPSLALATDTGSSNSDGITNDATVNVTLATDVASWQYSLNGGSTWTAGSSTSFELVANTAYSIGDVQVKQTDTAGNTSSAASNAAAITTDTSAPTAVATTATISNAENASVQSSELGTAYLVASDISVTSLSDITSSVDNQWNSVAITAANTPTNLAATGLVDGSYKVYTTDAAGNLSGASNNTVTIENIDTSIVVFDLTTGQSSSHSGRTFDASVSYTIYLYVDSDSGNVSMNQIWQGGANLAGDDQLVLVGDSGSVKGPGGLTVNGSITYPSYVRWSDMNGIALAVYASGMMSRNASGNIGSTVLWNGSWQSPPSVEYLHAGIPDGVLTSQGLA